jgi:[ribosomal protein S5]-alanine N-acetyltransferase
VSLLIGARVSLWPVTAEDGEEFVALARDSVNLHRNLIFAPRTAAEFNDYLARFDGVGAVGFVVRLNSTRELVGLVNINAIVRSPDRRGALGFGGFTATAGHGYVGEGVRLAVRYAFEELRLDRLEADVQPGNAASRKVVEQAGLRPLGSAPKVICIAGTLYDHERWAITARHGPGNELGKREKRTYHAES